MGSLGAVFEFSDWLIWQLMFDQNESEQLSIVGEDGELLKPDNTINPTTYNEYIATHVHRDPLLFRIRQHIKEWGYAYIIVVPTAIFFVMVLIAAIFASYSDDWEKLGALTMLALFGAAIYKTLYGDTRQ